MDWQKRALPAIMVAPNGARRLKSDHPQIPLGIAETVETAIACHAAGAGAIHFHVRDADGQHVLDAGQYREGLAEMARRVPAMHLQITTETVGRYGPEDMQKVLRDVIPQGASIGVAEMIPSRRPTRDDAAFYDWAHDAGIQIQHICYSPEDVALLAALLDMTAKDMRRNLWCLFVIGHYTGAVSDPAMLGAFTAMMGRHGLAGDWAICAFSTEETRCLDAAITAGGKVRVGFENSMLMRDGRIAANNAERVSEVAGMLGVTGHGMQS